MIHLDREQAEILATDLWEYVRMKDSSERNMFEEFWLSIDEDKDLCLEPIANYTLIEGDEKKPQNIDSNKSCTHCGHHTLEFVKGYEPYTVDYIQCERCHSTYNIDSKGNAVLKDKTKKNN